MKRTYLLMLLACFCAAGIINISCSSGENKKSGSGETQSTTTTPGTMQTLDAFSRQAVNRSIYADYKGKRVYFCCDKSRSTFNADPGKYLDEFKRQGVTLENTP